MESRKKLSRKDSSSNSLFKLLLRWKGSLYKLCYKEILIFVIAFGIASLTYRNFLYTDYQKDVFKQLVRYCDTYITKLPISWILGFYVATVATRWWQQCMTLPTPDRLVMSIVMYVPGDDDESRLLRKTLCQNCNLMIVLLLRSISDSVRSKWETLDDLVKAGFMTMTEKDLYESAQAEYPGMDLHWLPGIWFAHNMRDAQKQGKISFNDGARLIMAEFLTIRSKCETLWSYDWVSIPIIYRQVVTLATYSFFIASVLGRQFVGKPEDDFSGDIFFPTWIALENLFYLGMLKVANHMLNPTGNDDEDFDLIYLIKQQANVVHMGTHEFWDKRPSMDPSTLEKPKLDGRKKESLKERLSRVLSTIGVISSRRSSKEPTDLQRDVIAEDSLATFTGNRNSMFINDGDGIRLDSTFDESIDRHKISIEINYI